MPAKPPPAPMSTGAKVALWVLGAALLLPLVAVIGMMIFLSIVFGGEGHDFDDEILDSQIAMIDPAPESLSGPPTIEAADGLPVPIVGTWTDAANDECPGAWLVQMLDDGDPVPRPALVDDQDRLGDGVTQRALGWDGAGRYLAHTFVLPSPAGRIVGGNVDIQVGAAYGDGDTISFGVRDGQQALIDTTLAKDVFPLVGEDVADSAKFHIAWNLVDLGDGELLAAARTAGYLDVVVEDATTVHRITISLCVLPVEETAAGGEVPRGTTVGAWDMTNLARCPFGAAVQRVENDPDQTFRHAFLVPAEIAEADAAWLEIEFTDTTPDDALGLSLIDGNDEIAESLPITELASIGPATRVAPLHALSYGLDRNERMFLGGIQQSNELNVSVVGSVGAVEISFCLGASGEYESPNPLPSVDGWDVVQADFCEAGGYRLGVIDDQGPSTPALALAADLAVTNDGERSPDFGETVEGRTFAHTVAIPRDLDGPIGDLELRTSFGAATEPGMPFVIIARGYGGTETLALTTEPGGSSAVGLSEAGPDASIRHAILEHRRVSVVVPPGATVESFGVVLCTPEG